MKALRLPAVRDKIGLGHSRIYEMVKEGLFPRPIRLGEKSVAWLEEEVDAWLAARVGDRDSGAAR